MQATQLRPGKDHTVTVNEEILRTHSALERIFRITPLRNNRERPRGLGFRQWRNLLLRFGLGLRRLPSDRRGLCRRFLAIQIGDATPTFDSYPMLLTHDAFYRAEGVSTQREIKLRLTETWPWFSNRIAKNASTE
jgi:hypothetical protein